MVFDSRTQSTGQQGGVVAARLELTDGPRKGASVEILGQLKAPWPSRVLSRLIVAASAICLVGAPAAAKDAVYMSLMGEPYWTNSAGERPFDQWLKMADLDGDGAVSSVEFVKDADAFFASLDLNDDKIIDGDEMAKYEQLAPGRTRAAGGGAVMPSSARPKAKASTQTEAGQIGIVSGSDAPSATRIHPGGGRINFAEVPQPVAMADANLDRRVTVEEFRRTAGRRFGNYDVDKNGQLTRKELR